MVGANCPHCVRYKRFIRENIFEWRLFYFSFWFGVCFFFFLYIAIVFTSISLYWSERNVGIPDAKIVALHLFLFFFPAQSLIAVHLFTIWLTVRLAMPDFQMTEWRKLIICAIVTFISVIIVMSLSFMIKKYLATSDGKVRRTWRDEILLSSVIIITIIIMCH